MLLAWFAIQPWRWRCFVLPKWRWISTRQHNLTPFKIFSLQWELQIQQKCKTVWKENLFLSEIEERNSRSYNGSTYPLFVKISTLSSSTTGRDVWHVPLWQGMEFKEYITMVCCLLQRRTSSKCYHPSKRLPFCKHSIHKIFLTEWSCCIFQHLNASAKPKHLKNLDKIYCLISSLTK